MPSQRMDLIVKSYDEGKYVGLELQGNVGINGGPSDRPIILAPVTASIGGTEAPIKLAPVTASIGGTEAPIKLAPVTASIGGTEAPVRLAPITLQLGSLQLETDILIDFRLFGMRIGTIRIKGTNRVAD